MTYGVEEIVAQSCLVRSHLTKEFPVPDPDRSKSQPRAPQRRGVRWAERPPVAWFDSLPYASAYLNSSNRDQGTGVMKLAIYTIALAMIALTYLLAAN